ncbi:unnamed protein product [Mesocestoides corti]|uniref:Uncharacterized protein n=2 Tax=Mesocestoides corti TaxID=53468 RepID=A0A3P6GD92_MESCO|nr:unnamed protein product [Mesocestoides corti]
MHRLLQSCCGLTGSPRHLRASPAVCGRTSVDVDASSVTAGVTHPPSHGTPAINITTTANNTTSTPLKSSLKNVRVQEVDLRSKSEDSRADLDHNVAQKKTSKVTVKPQVLGPPKSPENSDWDSSDDDDDDGDDDDFKLPSLKSQAPSRQVFQRPLDEEMEEEEDIDDILGGLSPGHSVKFRDRNPTENFNNNATEAKGADKNDDVDDVSVSSLLDDEISKSRVSPIRPKTSRGGRTPLAPGSGSFRSSGTIVSPLCPGASYTISTSQWDTTASQGRL